MYSSLSSPEFSARTTRESPPLRNPSPSAADAVAASVATPEPPARPSRPLERLLSRFGEDDLLLVGLLFLLWNENSQDDPLILIVLAILLFT